MEYDNKKYQATYKLVIFGDGAVGKTTLTHRFITGVFGDNYRLTIGVEFFIHDFEVDGKLVKLQIWDFGGEDRFRFLMPSYSKGAMGGLFVFDLTKPRTLFQHKQWIEVVEQGAGKIPILMVGTKADLQTDRKIVYNEARETAQKNGFAGYVEVSAKTGTNVREAFATIAQIMHKRQTSVIIT